jgi:hypothetical protein
MGLNPDWVKPKTIKLVFVASPFKEFCTVAGQNVFLSYKLGHFQLFSISVKPFNKFIKLIYA